MFKRVENWLRGKTALGDGALEGASSSIDRPTYAIGDIHGCDGLLQNLLEQINRDAKGFNEKPRLIFLGDYIDRGPGSRQVMDIVSHLLVDPAGSGFSEVIALMGNHEQTLVQFLQDSQFGPPWSEHGGLTALASYGVSAPFPRHDAEAWERTRSELVEVFPEAHRQLLDSMRLYVTFGDYLFVHAGVKPGVDLGEQVIESLLWIRGEFLASKRACDYVVVHGHTPEEEARDLRWRIGLDTGAYATGKLTAVRLFGQERRFIQASSTT